MYTNERVEGRYLKAVVTIRLYAVVWIYGHKHTTLRKKRDEIIKMNFESMTNYSK